MCKGVQQQQQQLQQSLCASTTLPAAGCSTSLVLIFTPPPRSIVSRSDIFAPLMKEKYQAYQDKEVVSMM